MTGDSPQHTLPGWQALLLPPLAGVLVTLSLAPFDLWPLAILGCALLAYLLAGCSACRLADCQVGSGRQPAYRSFAAYISVAHIRYYKFVGIDLDIYLNM